MASAQGSARDARAERGERDATPAARSASSDSTERICTQKAAMKRCEWRLKTAVVRAVTDAGGIVFGGAVRDYWIHDQQAAAFYEALGEIGDSLGEKLGRGDGDGESEGDSAESESADASAAGDGDGAAESDGRLPQSVVYGLYNDAEFMPEYRGRCLMPYDIDACIHETRADDLLYALRLSRFGVQLLSDTEPCEYIPETTLLPGQMRHRRYRVYGFSSEAAYRIREGIQREIPAAFRSVFSRVINDFYDSMREVLPMFPAVTLDLMVSQLPLPATGPGANGWMSAAPGQPMPPFANLDFECNGLVLTRDGLGLSEHLKATLGARDNPMRQQREIARILGETLEWKARLAKPAPADYRVQKMARKGFRVVGWQRVREVAEPCAEGHCIICHGELDGAHYKLSCCEARYHARCLERAGTLGANPLRESETCPMCRQSAPGLAADVGVLSAILRVIPVASATPTASGATSRVPSFAEGLVMYDGGAAAAAEATATDGVALPAARRMSDVD